jgi:FkbM family methyltransferase
MDPMRFRELPTLFGLWPEFAFIDGVKVPIQGSLLSPRMRRHLMRGGYETAERKLLAQLIRSGDVVIELGASLGIVTTLLVKNVGTNGSVVAVEPNAQLIPHFERQLAVNGSSALLLTALCCPLWAEPVPEKVRRHRFTVAENSLSSRASDFEGDTLPWLNLQEIARQAGILAPSALFIDIEGGEQIWCEHPPRFPESVKTVIIETHPHLVGELKTGASVQALIHEGFEIACISGTVLGLTR